MTTMPSKFAAKKGSRKSKAKKRLPSGEKPYSRLKQEVKNLARELSEALLPPLRERKEDIPALATFFLKRSSLETKKQFTEITPEALERLLAYDWPGNIRELANVVERAVVLGQPPTVTLDDLPPHMVAANAKAPAGDLSYREAIDAARRELIMGALAQAKGNRGAAAGALGIHRGHLSRLMKSLRID